MRGFTPTNKGGRVQGWKKFKPCLSWGTNSFEVDFKFKRQLDSCKTSTSSLEVEVLAILNFEGVGGRKKVPLFKRGDAKSFTLS